MFSVPHLVVLFIVVLVFFGPHKLPELARGLGKLMAEFRKASNDFKMAFEEEMRTIERQARETEWKKSQEAAEAKRQAELSSSNASPAETTEGKTQPAEVSEAVPLEAEPVVTPVVDAIAREAQPSSAHQAEAETPAEDAPSSGAGSSPAPLPGHDQRQPA